MAKRLQYLQEDLLSAVSSVKKLHLTCSQASREYNIPRKTIEDALKGRYLKHVPGPNRMLDATEEDALVSYMKYMLQQGFPMTRAIARRYILSLMKKNARSSLFSSEKGPSNKWFRKFFSRHPELKEREPERLDRGRSRMSNENVMNSYFALLMDTIKKLGLEKEPGRIFNCDETGWSGREKPRQKVIGVKGHHTYQQALLTSGHITAHICISADGRVLPTFIIFEKSFPHTAYKDGVPGNWLFGTSESGYMDSYLFLTWFKDLFIPNCGKDHPVLLVMDNHDSHINLDVVKLARENHIELLGLPPHSTHILQPLDVGIMGPLKMKFSSIALNLGFINHHQTINKAKFPVILSYAIDHLCSPAKIKDSFKKSGLYPLNPDAIDKTQVMPSQFIQKVTSNQLPLTSSETVSLKSQDLNTSTCTEAKPSTSSITTTSSASNYSCDKCGSYLGGNPLVKEGIVPESLSEIFPPVPAKPQTAKRRCITEARVITSDKFYMHLLNRTEEEERRRKEIECRKIQREERKKQREAEKEQKGKYPEKGRKSTIMIKKKDVCEICKEAEPTTIDDELDVHWICCDLCEKWYHLACVGLTDEEDVDETYFICTCCSAKSN